MKNALAALGSIFQKRLKVIRVSYETILQYNTDMLTLKSAPENYHIIFCLSPELFLGNEEYMRLLISGADVGIYLYAFGNLNKMSDTYSAIIESVNHCTLLQNNQIISTAKSALIAQISNQRRE